MRGLDPTAMQKFRIVAGELEPASGAEEFGELGCRIRRPCNPNLGTEIPASITSLGGDAYVLESVNAGTQLEHVLLIVVNIVISTCSLLEAGTIL